MEIQENQSESSILSPKASPLRVLLVASTADGASWADGDGAIALTAVASAQACRDAIAASHPRPFDALVLDWTSDSTGQDVLARLRRAECPAAVIALVPPHHPEAVRAARRAGVTACLLTTPDYRLHLPQAVESAIEQARLHRENRRLDRALRLARRRTQEIQRQLRVLLDHLDAEQGRVVAANTAAERLWGVPLRVAERLDRRTDLRAEADDGTPIPPEASAPLRALRRGEAIYDEPVVLQPNARRIPVTIDAVPLRAADGTLTGVVSLVRDRSAPAQLAALREALVAVTSHQLKNPLTVILGYSALLLKSPVLDADSRARRAVAKIRRESLRLRHLADNLLEFSRLELGRVTVQAVPFDLADLVRSAAGRWRDAADARPIRLRLAPTALPYAGDYGRLAQALDCLFARRATAVANAELGVALGRYTPSELAATGTTAALPPGEAYATIAIGDGATAEESVPRRAAWRPFTATEQPIADATDRELDMLVSAALVRKHGGMLYASDDERGEGYLIVLPIA